MDRAAVVGAPTPFSIFEKLLIGAAIFFVGLKLVFAFGAPPLSDEAYYWMWGRHIELSYYDHPPLQAWVQGLSHLLFGTSLFALRLPTFLAAAAVLWIFYLTSRRLGGAGWRTIFLASTVVYLGSPLFGLLGTVAIHDYLLVVLAMGSGYGFIRYFGDIESGAPGNGLHLFGAATLLGLAGMSKYTAVFLALAVAMTIILRPKLRPLLRRWELYAAALLTLAVQLPVLIWNAQSGFASILYQSSKINDAGRLTGIDFGGMATFVIQTAALISPLIVVPVTARLAWTRQQSDFERVGKTLALSLFAVTSLTFLYVSNFAYVLWWWNLIAFVLVLPFAGRYIGRIGLVLHLVWGALINTFLTISLAIVPLGPLLRAETDLNYGQDELAAMVREAQAGHDTRLVVANRYQTASQLAFALDDPEVVAITPGRDSFDDWFDPAAHLGQDAIVLVARWDDIDYWKQYFRSTQLLQELTIHRFDRKLAIYELWLAKDFAPPR